VDTHVRVLGVLYVALGALGLMCAAFLVLGFGGAAGIVAASAEPDDAAVAVPILSLVSTFLVAFISAFSLPAVVIGIGLLYFKSWARIMAIVLSAISLLGFPWITILGIYGLWVLFNRETERLFTVHASPQ
jgi:hypothetical protein